MITVNVGFVNSDGQDDETQFDIVNTEDLNDLFEEFCIENGMAMPAVEYIDTVGYVYIPMS